ncbi:MAG: hypothetical protein WD066_18330, partial [Planctomycetaceae bacterium]
AEPIRYRQSGMSICTADGQVLGTATATTKAEVLRGIRSALPKYEPPATPYQVEPQGDVDPKHFKHFEPPEGAAVANCIMTHLSERGPGIYPGIEELLSQTVGMDRVWILKEEAAALADDEFPESLKRRIARWHLINNNWFGQNRLDSLKKFDVELNDGRLSGSVEINGIELDLLGFIEVREGKITRFDIVARGTRRYPPGSKGGHYQPLSTDPYPLAYAFALTDENHFTYRIPPHTVLSHDEKVYFGN